MQKIYFVLQLMNMLDMLNMSFVLLDEYAGILSLNSRGESPIDLIDGS